MCLPWSRIQSSLLLRLTIRWISSMRLTGRNIQGWEECWALLLVTLICWGTRTSWLGGPMTLYARSDNWRVQTESEDSISYSSSIMLRSTLWVRWFKLSLNFLGWWCTDELTNRRILIRRLVRYAARGTTRWVSFRMSRRTSTKWVLEPRYHWADVIVNTTYMNDVMRAVCVIPGLFSFLEWYKTDHMKKTLYRHAEYSTEHTQAYVSFLPCRCS